MRRKWSDDGNLIGRANPNPILDTHHYEEKFGDGEVTELNANVIAESLYAPCDADGNKYLMLDSFVDYQRSDNELTLDLQKIAVNG